MKHARILVLTHFFPPEMGAAAARLMGLASQLAGYGHEITVSTGFPNYPDGILHGPYRHRWIHVECSGRLTIQRHCTYASPVYSLLRRTANALSVVCSSAVSNGFSESNYDLIIASSPPLFVGLSAYCISRVKQIPVIFDVRDLWPDVAIDAGVLNPDSKMVRIARKVEKFIYSHADRITVVTNRKLEKIAEKGVPRCKLCVIPNGFDEDFVRTPISLEQLAHTRKQLGVRDSDCVVLYAGLFGKFQGLNILLRAAHILLERQDIVFVLVGDGPEREELVRCATAWGLTNVRFIDRQPRERIPLYMSLASTSLVPLSHQGLDDSVPSKLLESMAFALPVILAAQGESAEIVMRANCGVVIHPNDHSSLADAIATLARSPSERLALGQNGRLYAWKHFSRGSAVQSLHELITERYL